MSFITGTSSFVESDLPAGVSRNNEEGGGERKAPGGDHIWPEEAPSAIPAINSSRLGGMRAGATNQPARASPPRFRHGRDETADSCWLPHQTVTEDRCKAYVAWVALLGGAAVWLTGVVHSARDRRANPPVRIHKKVEPFGFPDVVVCPTSGAGCDADDPLLCLQGMRLFVSALAGFEEDADDLTSTLETAVSAAAATVDTSQQGLTAMLDPVAHSWCPVIPLSELTIDRDGIDSGDVQSLHASVYVLWSDEVAETPLPSTRQFLNTFFLIDGGLEGAVLSRFPYDRVSINGTDPVTFVANDVTVGLKEHVPLGADEGTTERIHTQVATTGQQTLALDGADERFAGAIMFASFSINGFSFESTEEVDVVDYRALVGAAGGILVIMYVLFGLLFMPSRREGPRRVWLFSRRRRRRRSSKLEVRTTSVESSAAREPVRASI